MNYPSVIIFGGKISPSSLIPPVLKEKEGEAERNALFHVKLWEQTGYGSGISRVNARGLLIPCSACKAGLAEMAETEVGGGNTRKK